MRTCLHSRVAVLSARDAIRAEQKIVCFIAQLIRKQFNMMDSDASWAKKWWIYCSAWRQRSSVEVNSSFIKLIMKILKHAGINRVVTRLNPTTGEPEHCVISYILSSHSAIRSFSGNIYDKVQDPNLICPLTGHKEGSKAFNRYRKIDEDTNRKTVSLLE